MCNLLTQTICLKQAIGLGEIFMIQARLTLASSSWCFHTARCWNDLLYCKVERQKMQLHLSGANFKKSNELVITTFPSWSL